MADKKSDYGYDTNDDWARGDCIVEPNGLRVYPDGIPGDNPCAELECAWVNAIRDEHPELVVFRDVEVVNGRLVIPTAIFWCLQVQSWLRKACDHEDCHNYTTMGVKDEPELAWLDKQIKDDF